MPTRERRTKSRATRAQAAPRWPFIVTIAAAVPACTPGRSGDSATPTATVPTPAGATATETEAPPPEPTASATASGTQAPKPALATVARLVRRHDGTCVFEYGADCAPGVKCNPPGPKPVVCPPRGQDVDLRSDGTCFVRYDGVCPPMTPCNPPAPSVQPCPPDK